MPQNAIVTLILAAGASSRMGKPKQVLPWKNMTLLGHTITVAQQSKTHGIVVVLGANAKRIQNLMQHDDTVVYVENTSWKQGLGSSIARGMEYVLSRKRKIGGVLVLLADQPLIDSHYVDRMIDHHTMTQKSIIATSYGNGYGVPALFPVPYFKELSRLDGDIGARSILNRDSKNIVSLNPEEKILDIDTPLDYDHLIKIKAHTK